MVRIPLSMCVPDLQSPADIYRDPERKNLLIKKGTALSDRMKERLRQNGAAEIEFPLPFETADPPPYTFSQKTESALFTLVRETYLAFKENAVEKPLEVRKTAYEILAQAAEEFKRFYSLEHPILDTPPKRDPRSVLHLRTVGCLDDYLFEHAKNVALACVALCFDYFRESSQVLAEIHKTAVAGLFADIGMMKIPSRIMTQETDLSEDDWAKIHQHPEASAAFVNTLFKQKDFVTATVVLQHHERNDKKGYPAQLAGYKLEPYTRLLAAVDSYFSMVSKRYFRSAQKPVDALLALNQEAAKNRIYDADAVRCLNFRIAPYPVGSVARFAADKLVQVVNLTQIPKTWEKTPLLSAGDSKGMYNMPKAVRRFTTKDSAGAVKAVDISEHWKRLGPGLDTFDLLKLYGYTKAG